MLKNNRILARISRPYRNLKPMYRFLINRLVWSFITIIAINYLVFTISRIAGDPVAAYVTPTTPPSAIETIRKQYGLDEPIPIQFIFYIKNLLNGDLGRAPSYGHVRLSEIIYRYLPLSFELNLISFILIIPISYWMATKAAINRDSVFDHTARITGILGHSVPSFFIGLLILMLLYPWGWINVDPVFWFPRVTGMPSIDAIISWDYQGLREAIRYMIGPVLTSFIMGFASNTRILRSSILEELSKEYIITGRAKGLSENYVSLNYARKNALIPFLTMLGLSIAHMFSGNVIMEVVFNRAGIGAISAAAAQVSDHNAIQAFTMIYSVMIVLCNLGVDIIYGFIDPRIRYGD